MKSLPRTKNTIVLRTDFSDESAWDAVRATIMRRRPAGYFQDNVEFVADPAFAGVAAEQVPALVPKGDDVDLTFLFLVVAATLRSEEHPVLVVDLLDAPGRAFRAIPAELWSIESNLFVGNMGFEEFAESVQADGVFRGFPR